MSKKLNKKDLYMLYVEEKQNDREIAKLYNKEEVEIRNLREKWNININQRLMADFKEIAKMYKKFNYLKESQFVLQEYVGIPRFKELYMPILDKLKDQEMHKIEEFWDMTDNDYIPTEKEKCICGKDGEITLYYRANWCIFEMLKDKVIEQGNGKQYQITEKGIELYNKQGNVEKIQRKEINPKQQYKKLIEIIYDSKPKKSHKKTKQEKSPIPRKIDFEKINREKKSMGDFCEEMVLCREKEIISDEGRPDLVDKIKWIPKEKGDGAGYDIESFRKFGDKYEKVYIEVKGTNRSQFDHFYVTINELKASWEYKDKYFICQIINAKKDNPRIKYTQGEIDKKFELKAIQFEANVKQE